MESYASRGIILGVSVLITVAIASAVFIVLGYVLDIYKNVAKIDYASLMKTGDIEKYSVSRYVGGNTIDGEQLKGVQLYNLLNKIISQHNMKLLDSEDRVTLKDCLDTWNNQKNVVLNTNSGLITVKNLSSGDVINFFDEDGNYDSFAFKTNYYCAIVKENEFEETLYFKYSG